MEKLQGKFDFSAPQPRPFMANLPAKIEIYEDGIADFFHWRTGLDYYMTIDRIVDFVVDAERREVLDLFTDTAVFALNLAGRKAFEGHIRSLDSNITLLERAKQRALQLKLNDIVSFRDFREPNLPVPSECIDAAVSIFDFHRHPPSKYLEEVMRVLIPGGYLILADIMEPRTSNNSLVSIWKKIQLKYIKKNVAEADAVYYDRDELISLLFAAGFRQVIVQGLSVPSSSRTGVFSLVTATK